MAGSDDYLNSWRQGDVFRRWGRRWVLISRTCDIVREIDRKPKVHVTPAVHRPDDEEAHKWRRPQLAPLPAYEDGGWCADLDQIQQMHKRNLKRRKPLASVETGEQERFLRRHLGRYLSKPSWEQYVEKTVEPIAKRMRSKYSKESPEGSLIAAVLDIRITVQGADPGPRDHDSPRALLLTFVMAPEALPLGSEELVEPSAKTKQWYSQSRRGLHDIAKRRSEVPTDADAVWLLERYVETVVGECEPHSPISNIHWEVVAHDEFGFDRVKASSPIEVEYLSYGTR
jgi:hypothetical protein